MAWSYEQHPKVVLTLDVGIATAATELFPDELLLYQSSIIQY